VAEGEMTQKKRAGDEAVAMDEDEKQVNKNSRTAKVNVDDEVHTSCEARLSKQLHGLK